MTAAVADLATRDHVEVAYLLVWAGVPFCYTNRPELVGTAWIGEETGRRVLEGLDVRGSSYAFATEMQTGRADTDDGLSVKVTDFDRELIEFFREKTEEAIVVGGRLGPKDDPAPASMIGKDFSNVSIWGKWVNTEAIGAAGERSQYSIFPTGDPCGQDHAAYNGEIDSLATSLVFDGPTHLEGRRAACYRIFRDPDTGEWPSWTDQYLSGHSLVWVGVLTNEVSVDNLTWTINMDGPSSWLRKQLGANRPADWQPVFGQVTLNTTPGQREDLFAFKSWYQQVLQAAPQLGASSVFTASDVLPATGVGYDFRVALQARISTVSATAGPDITWTTARNASAVIEATYIATRIDELAEAASFVRGAVWTLCMHEKVWRALGYDPILQAATNYDTNLEIRFVPGEQSGLPVPGPGYYVGYFWTVPEGFNSVDNAGGDADNGGKFRAVLPLGPEDVTTLTPQAGFDLVFGIGSPSYLEGQTNRAPVQYSLGGGVGAVDSQAYVAFRGSRKDSLDADVTTEVQVAQVCFKKASDDSIALDSGNAVRVAVTNYIDPRFYGVDRTLLDRIYLSQDLEFAWVNMFGHNFSGGDKAHELLLRTMLSTGTSYWTGFDGDGAVLTPGVNHPLELAATPTMSDTEIADLGLAIPNLLIDIPSFTKAANSLPSGGTASPLNRCRYAFIGATDAQELIASILAPRGWAMGFNAGRWRLFSRPDLLTGDDVEVVISPDAFVGEPEFVEPVELRPFTPRERFTVDFGHPLVSEGAPDETDLTLTARALDPAARSRADNGSDDIDGWGLIPVPLWEVSEEIPPDWRTAWQALFSRSMARWFNSAHILISGLRVVPSIARQVGPGTVVRFTSHYAATREGTYGPAAMLGRIYRVEHDLETREARIDVLLQPGTTTTTRAFAPIAVVTDTGNTVEARWDVTTRTVTCKQDAFGHGVAGLHDVAAFAEPDWLGVGGDALVYGWQWDGRVWSQTFSFLVESVDAAANTITWKAGSLSGTFWDSRYAVLVLAPYDLQPGGSWTKDYFSVLTRSDFKFGAGPTKGFPLV